MTGDRLFDVRKNWSFAGSLREGELVVAVMSLIQSARLNDHDPVLIVTGLSHSDPAENEIGRTPAANQPCARPQRAPLIS